MGTSATITAAVEGTTDEALLKRVCGFIGVSVGQIYGRYGKAYVLTRLNGYNHSARFRHWVVLLDLNGDAECAPQVRPQWLPAPSRLMCLRVAVRELESWLLADSERVTTYLSVRDPGIPQNPDEIDDPKLFMVNLARRSRRRAIREDMVPLPGSGQNVGPAYTSRIVEFVQDTQSGWRPDVAASRSDSLRRCMAAITHLAQQPF